MQEVTAILNSPWALPSLTAVLFNSLFALLNWAANSVILFPLLQQDPKHRHWLCCKQTGFGWTGARAGWHKVTTRQDERLRSRHLQHPIVASCLSRGNLEWRARWHGNFLSIAAPFAQCLQGFACVHDVQRRQAADFLPLFPIPHSMGRFLTPRFAEGHPRTRS